MQRIVLLFAVLIGFSQCNQQPASTPATAVADSPAAGATVPATSGVLPDLPGGANTQTFEDSPGLVRVWANNENGSKRLEGYYLNGLRHGMWIEYQLSGLPQSVTPYVNGKREGTYLEFNTSNSLVKRIQYHNDLRHGDYREYNFSNVKEERFYQFDKIEGLVKIFYDNGKVMEEGLYKGGTRDGESKWYDQNGNLSITYTYQNGQLVKK
jgi:antitoxin component YwqK of YwqJK toxin-antitoxin module